MGEEKPKFNLHQPLPLTEQERVMCRKFYSLLQSKEHMFEQSPLSINEFTSTSHRGDCFEEIVAEPPAIIKGDFEFLSPLQYLEEIILNLNGYEKKGEFTFPNSLYCPFTLLLPFAHCQTFKTMFILKFGGVYFGWFIMSHPTCRTC